jgi:DNA (cytosine-5)-methyltransferase 1
MKHIDLFSGIGGFALAVDRVWPGAEHLFCDNDKFCQAVLHKHWPGAKIYGDIQQLTANANCDRLDAEYNTSKQINNKREYNEKKNTIRRRGFELGTNNESSANAESRESGKSPEQKRRKDTGGGNQEVFILTGGFPCQPFSQAGRRKGTEDDRFLWPFMLKAIQLTKPEWVIAENVRGITTIENGMVLEQVCSDLESQGYEVQPFIIPAVAVNAPHRRDRVWFIAHRTGERNGGIAGEKCGIQKRKLEPSESQGREIRGKGKRCVGEQDASDTDKGRIRRHECTCDKERTIARDSWERNWVEVASELCRVDDGVSARLGETLISGSKHREHQLKAYGNAIVPQVAEMIMRAIQETRLP